MFKENEENIVYLFWTEWGEGRSCCGSRSGGGARQITDYPVSGSRWTRYLLWVQVFPIHARVADEEFCKSSPFGIPSVAFQENAFCGWFRIADIRLASTGGEESLPYRSFLLTFVTVPDIPFRNYCSGMK